MTARSPSPLSLHFRYHPASLSLYPPRSISFSSPFSRSSVFPSHYLRHRPALHLRAFNCQQYSGICARHFIQALPIGFLPSACFCIPATPHSTRYFQVCVAIRTLRCVQNLFFGFLPRLQLPHPTGRTKRMLADSMGHPPATAEMDWINSDWVSSNRVWIAVTLIPVVGT